MANIEKTNSEIAKFVKYLHKNGELEPFLEDIYLITLHVAGLYYIGDIDKIITSIKKGIICSFLDKKITSMMNWLF